VSGPRVGAPNASVDRGKLARARSAGRLGNESARATYNPTNQYPIEHPGANRSTRSKVTREEMNSASIPGGKVFWREGQVNK
jgi:hypothetical protein